MKDRAGKSTDLARPNVLLIMTDQQRADSLGCAGHPAVRTPHIDGLAASGVRFDCAYTTHPTCTPSRGAIFTGRYPSSHGARMTGMILPESERVLPAVLREHGYETALFGKPHFAPMGDYADCPSREMRHLWNDGAHPIEGDYYGFENVVFFGGHGPGIWGHYRDWLRERDPAAERVIENASGDGGYMRAGAYEDGLADMFRSPLPAELHPTSALGEMVSDYLRRRHEKPFFLVASFSDPHHPFAPPSEYADRYDPGDMPIPVPPDSDGFRTFPPHFGRAYRGQSGMFSGGGHVDYSAIPPAAMLRARALTCGMVELIDAAVGNILRTLDETGLRRSTVIVFCSDHGDFLGDHGFLYKGPMHWDGLTRVPFIWNLPGALREGVTESGVASTLDVTPTVLDLCGIPPEPGIEGISLAPYLRGQETYARDEALTENDDDYLGERLRTLVTGEWKITAYAGRPWGELYDRVNDPHETRNLWDDPAFRGPRDEMRLRLLDHLMRREDRLPVQRWYA
ncbi:MAG TPA: sulfatase-like hydrolase/transferase [Candidatus Latescibacteria bacterium]|nr:sulfatase-like hydrolase/transferase [Candidatus Latescibacterota bacterium]